MPPQRMRLLNVEQLKGLISKPFKDLSKDCALDTRTHKKKTLQVLCCSTSFSTCEEFASQAMEVVILTGGLCVGDAALLTDHNGAPFEGF